jgi:ABC-2 type transport system ATP-binding protein
LDEEMFDLEYAVKTIKLTKRYGSLLALDSLDLKVDQNMILVLLGPNGSGKSTFLHLISTVLKPSNGTAKVMGYDIVEQPLKVRQVTSIAFQDPRGFWRHKPKHILSFHASMYGINGAERSAIVERVMKDFDLWESRDKKFMDLSGGQAKRLEVAKLFVHKPQLALLDEPTAMVDLDGKRIMWDKIRELKESGCTVIVATNEVREAEYLADRISIFAKGKEIITESLVDLKDTIKGGDVVEMEFIPEASDSVIYALASIPGTVSINRISRSKLKISVSRSEDWLPLATNYVHNMGLKLLSIRVSEPSLDDVFMNIIRTRINN